MGFTATYDAVPTGVVAARRDAARIAREHGFVDARVSDIELAVSEAATNVVLHAYADEPGRIRLTVQHASGRLTITVADEGRGMVPRRDSPGLGLGMPIMATVADNLEVISVGTGAAVRMTFAPGSAG